MLEHLVKLAWAIVAQRNLLVASWLGIATIAMQRSLTSAFVRESRGSIVSTTTTFCGVVQATMVATARGSNLRFTETW